MVKQVLSFWNITDEVNMRQCHNHVWEIDSKYMVKMYESKETMHL